VFDIAKGVLRIRANEPDRGRPTGLDAASDVELVLRRADRNAAYVHVMNLDGTGQRILVAPAEFTGVGSPEWSRDGKKLAFDAWRSIFGENFRLAHTLVCNADGTDLVDLGVAAMPTWSPEGRKIGYSSYEPNGVFMMNADGTKPELVDPEGWAIEWCPVGNRVAYTVHDSGAANVRVRDLASGKVHDLFDGRYFYIYYGMCWSPDGQWIALVGRRADASYELAIVHVDGYEKGFRVLAPTAESEGFRPLANPSWSPDSRQVLAALIKSSQPAALYTIDVENPHKIHRVPGQREDCAYGSPAWSPDGKKIIFCARKLPGE